MRYLRIEGMDSLNRSSSRADELRYGGKIILPASCLSTYMLDNYSGPMVFQLTYDSSITYCGVEEFTADEGYVLAPNWIFKTLDVERGCLIEIEAMILPAGTFAKFKPQSIDFLEIEDHRAVLENTLNHYVALTIGDIIDIKYNDTIYSLEVEELEPEDAISTFDIDLAVDFSPPVGYIPPKPVFRSIKEKITNLPSVVSLDGKVHPKEGIHPLRLPDGLLMFKRTDA